MISTTDISHYICCTCAHTYLPKKDSENCLGRYLELLGILGALVLLRAFLDLLLAARRVARCTTLNWTCFWPKWASAGVLLEFLWRPAEAIVACRFHAFCFKVLLRLALCSNVVSNALLNLLLAKLGLSPASLGAPREAC